jgi:hypothetical protein
VLEDIAWVATAVGVLVAAFSVRAANSQRRRQFETIYVQRYWALMDQLSLDALKDGQSKPHNSMGPLTVADGQEICHNDQRIVHSYLRLCEDELELRREGWISSETWAIWQAGIAAQLQRWPFRPLWRDTNLQTGPNRPDRATPKEFELLRAFMDGGNKDPLRTVSRQKRFARFVRRLLTGAP